MNKNESRAPSNEPICKKIQNYIFKFTDMLGKGNFSKVYKAHHEITNQTVAIKIIQLNSLKSQKLQQLLFSEIDVLKKLNHPNILRCFEVFTSNRNCYIITEICNGGDLETKLRREHHFSEPSAQPIVKDILCGLVYLAQKNVIHRDLKIANVFLHHGKAKIADFGFAKFTKQNFKDINIGSPIYMSPEGLIHNIYGPKTDIWAFGVLLYELLHGETPFAHCRTEAELNHKKMRDDLSQEMKQIISMCMEVDEGKRASAFDLENLPYFQRLLDRSPKKRIQSPVIQKKYTTASQKYVGTNNTLAQDVLARHHFLAPPKDESIGRLTKKTSSPMNYREPNLNPSTYQRRRQSSQKKYVHGVELLNYVSQKPTPQPQNPSYPSSTSGTSSCTSPIFSQNLSFKECVNILHYCRLFYKYVILLKETESLGNRLPDDSQQIRICAGWVLLVMDQVKNMIGQGHVLYDNENSYIRQRKLREVSREYNKKYNTELGAFSQSELSLHMFLAYLKGFFENVDCEIGNGLEEWCVVGHYLVMMVESTFVLKKCYDDHNYRHFGNYKEIEELLGKNKDTLDSNSYKFYRKRLSFIKDRIQ